MDLISQFYSGNNKGCGGIFWQALDDWKLVQEGIRIPMKHQSLALSYGSNAVNLGVAGKHAGQFVSEYRL